jgi:hypothetical protein
MVVIEDDVGVGWQGKLFWMSEFGGGFGPMGGEHVRAGLHLRTATVIWFLFTSLNFALFLGKKLFVIMCHTSKAVRSVEGRLQLQRFVRLSTANLCSSILLAVRSRLKAQSLQFRQGCTLLKRKIFT